MKKSAIANVAAFGCLCLLTACSGASSLSEKITGRWAGVPERLFDTSASSATMMETYSFAASDSVENGGTVTVSALVSVTGAISGAEGISQPVSLTASGYAAVDGTWRAISGDKVELRLNMSTMTVAVDPDAVIVSSDMLSDSPDSDSARLTSLRPGLSKSIAGQLRKAVGKRYKPVMTLTNVAVDDHGSRLKFKIEKISYKLMRQP